MTNDDMLQKIKYYMVLSPLFLFIRSHSLLCLVVKHLIETILPFVLFFLTLSNFCCSHRGIRMWNCSSLPPSVSQTLSGMKKTVRGTPHKWEEEGRKGLRGRRKRLWGKLSLSCEHDVSGLEGISSNLDLGITDSVLVVRGHFDES